MSGTFVPQMIEEEEVTWRWRWTVSRVLYQLDPSRAATFGGTL
jgi:hypothetical protein